MGHRRFTGASPVARVRRAARAAMAAAASSVMLVLACGGSRGTPVRVDTFPDPGTALSRSAPLCFVQPEASWPLDARVEYQEIADKCAAAARYKGFSVTPVDGHCLRARLVLSVLGKERYEGSKGECATRVIGDAAFTKCSTDAAYSKTYAKTLHLRLFDPSGARQVYEARATLVSPFADIRPQTTVTLCHAALQEFPRRVRAAQYHVALE